MPFFSNKKLWFAGLTLAVLASFFCFRPLNSASYRIIAADGLGYYSYLPARFIYNDPEFKFSWFDQAFTANYDNHLFETPSDNFMVQLGNRRINKYYPGQSLLQMPFFLAAHLAAHLFHYPADGFSFPYQLAMGLAAVFYALLGLVFCSKLLLAVFKDQRLALLVPLLVFFGSNLFTYTVFSGCYSHAYSFCMVTLSYYSAYLFFNVPGRRLFYLLLVAFFSVMVLSIRPLNGLLLGGLLYFYKPFSIREAVSFRENKLVLLGLLLLIIGAAAYSLDLIHRQTQAFFINSYAGERFYFNKPGHILDNFFGFQYGMLWYVPIIVLSLGAVFMVKRQPSILFLIMPVLALIVLYSFWWYWNIVSRAIVDSSVLLALLLGHVLSQGKSPRLQKALLTAALLCVPLFQLKAYQLRQGILDGNYTYFKYYAKHFFTLRPVSVFPVNPRTVIDQQGYFSDFENEGGMQVPEAGKWAGSRAAVLNAQVDYAATSSYPVPAFFEKEGFKKVRASFWIRSAGEIDNIHCVFTFLRNDSSLAYVPFYMKGNGLRKEEWEYKEFGMDLPGNVKPGDRLSIYFWNPDHKSEAYIDNLKTEFFLTDGSEEVTVSQ